MLRPKTSLPALGTEPALDRRPPEQRQASLRPLGGAVMIPFAASDFTASSDDAKAALIPNLVFAGAIAASAPVAVVFLP